MKRAVVVGSVLSLVGVVGLVGTAAPLAYAAGSTSLTTLGTASTENFDTLATTTAASAVPNGWHFLEGGTNANTTYDGGTGSGTAGNTYSFGAASVAERAFGTLLSGSLNSTIGASFTNDTGQTISQLEVSYVGEMWRAGVANRNAADRLDFQFSLDATALNDGTWVDHDALDYQSSSINTTLGAKDGNSAAFRTDIAATIGGLNVAPGATIWIRWTDFNISSSDDGLGIDDFELTPLAAPDAAPAVTQTVPANGSTDVPLDQSITVTFSEAVTTAATWFTLECASSGAHTATVSGGPTVFTINPDTDFTTGEACTLTVLAGSVTDQDGNDPPDLMELDFTAGFTTETDLCLAAATPISAVQGSGPAAAITGVVTVQGVVVGDYEYAGSGSTANNVRGYFVQDLNPDADPATSEGIFVFNGNLNSAGLGDVVRITGTASEFQGQTQIGNVTFFRNCGTASVDPVDVTLPLPDADHLERYEGMLVRLPQTLSVTEHFQLGRFGQVVVSSGGRLQQPTNMVAPGAAALAMQAQNNLNRIIIDDALQQQNPDPIAFGRGGTPLSASNTLRGGDTATGTVGVLSYTWGGNAASPNAYRVRPIGALGGAVNFQAVNERPVAAPAVGGTVKVVGMNLLNFFNTFDGLPDNVDNCTNGTAGPATDCRGADTAAEFDRQWPKTVAAILAMDPDVLGVNEIENDGYGPTSSIQFLVDQLNAATAPGTYAFVDIDALTGQTDAMGTDAIRVGLIYQPAVVSLTGATAVLNSVDFVNGGDSAPRNRATVAQAFSVNDTGAVFVVNVNHLKSKGSACDLPDQGDGQGNCAAVRTYSAGLLAAWLGSDPTGTGDPDVLMVGDYNSYALEDPITTLQTAGFTNLISTFLGPDAYSYVFDGQWGYLDHALGSASVVPQVQGVGDYHINSDEPSVIDYNTDFKTPGLQASLYAPDQFRVSDHDPVVIGLVPNADPTVSAGPFTVAEGSTLALSATAADPNGDALTYAWDLDGDSVVDSTSATPTFDATGLDGPTTVTVTVTVTDPLGLSATASAVVTVTNVAPTAGAAFAAPAAACGAGNGGLTVTFTDPAAADTHQVVVNWGDGSADTVVSGAISPTALAHTYGAAGVYVATVTVTDDDGGTVVTTATMTVNYTTWGIKLPGVDQGDEDDDEGDDEDEGDGGDHGHGRHGRSASSSGHHRTLPVSVRFVDCDGSRPADLTPTITLTVLTGPRAGTVITQPPVTGHGWTPGVMRFHSGQYTYLLSTSRLPDQRATYLVTVTVPSTGQTVTATFRLRH